MKIQITDQTEEDFIRDVITVKAEDGGVSRLWKIPRRLMMRADMAGIVVEEMSAEIAEARKAKVARLVKEAANGR